jgi:hypothetical protein
MGEPRPRNTLTLLRPAGVAGLLLLAVGCTTDSSRDGAKRDDPILGIGARPSYQAPAAPTASIPNSTAAQGPPPPAYQPQPPLTSAMPTSSAALASGGFQPLQGGSDLRMGSNTPPANNNSPAFPDPRNGAPAQPTAGFSPVTPVPPPGAPASPPPATPIGTPTAGGTLDQLYAAVTARNPLSYRMTFNSQAGEYTFQMTVPSKLNSAAVQHVEASAATPTAAIQRTLEQLTN